MIQTSIHQNLPQGSPLIYMPYGLQSDRQLYSEAGSFPVSERASRYSGGGTHSHRERRDGDRRDEWGLAVSRLYILPLSPGWNKLQSPYPLLTIPESLYDGKASV